MSHPPRRSPAPLPHRRDCLATLGCFALPALAGPLAVSPALEALAAPDAPPPPALPPLNRFPRMVQEWFVAAARQAARPAAEHRAKLQTRADAEAYVRSVRERIRQAFGPEPPRTPLNPRITGTVERRGYKIEKVLFESRPGFLVSANLYLPTDRPGPLPGVVGSCGHSLEGKAGDTYQAFAQSLAKLGYVVLIFDPIGQGERLQYVDAAYKPRRGVGVSEHLYAGNQQFLVGEFFGAWRAWDGIRALDYLLSRPEVDPRHVGITGNSGGGTLTTWLTGLDPRWTMSAPGCFVTTFLRNLENELPADTEQCPPRALALGLDHADFLAALAPKPVAILAKERDYFDARGAEEAYERLQRLYTLLEAPDEVRLHVGPTEHGYSQENREAMYAWFQRATGREAPAAEPPLELEKQETLWCAPHGQVAALGSRTIFSFTAELAQAQVRRRPAPSDDRLPELLRTALRLPPPADSPPDYRILRPVGGRAYPRPHATTYAVETEPQSFALVTRLDVRPHYSRPPRGQGRALLYVSHHSADAELRSHDFVRGLIESEPATPAFACDVRGVGESRPDTCGGVDQFARPYGSDYFYAIHALMLDRPYVGLKTLDLLRTLDWLAAAGHSNVRLAALGWGTVPAVFAAVLSPVVAELTLHDALESYAGLAENEEYRWPLSSFLPGVLDQFDLPDCHAWLRRHKRLSVTFAK